MSASFRRTASLLVVIGACTLLGACAEKAQVSSTSVKKPDVPAYRGTGTAYATTDWKQGDAASWEEQMRNRAVRGQNEYGRAASQP